VTDQDGPEAGLALADGLAGDDALTASHLFHSTRADLLRRLGRADEAAAAYRRARALARTTAEQRRRLSSGRPKKTCKACRIDLVKLGSPRPSSPERSAPPASSSCGR